MATAYYTPGVYIEEVNNGPRPIQGVGTSVTAFIGFTKKAEDINEDGYTTHSILSQPKLVTNWTQFERNFGGFDDNVSKGAYLPYAVRGFFDNGGVTAWVISIHAFDTHPAQALIPGKNAPSLIIHAKQGGPAGDRIKVTIKEAPKSNGTTDAGRNPASAAGPATTPGASAASTPPASGAGTPPSTPPPPASSSTPNAASSTPPADFILTLEDEGKPAQNYPLNLDKLPIWSERDRELADVHQLPEIKVWRFTRSGKLEERMPKFAAYQLEGGAPKFDLDFVREADRTTLGNPNSDATKTEDAFRTNAISLFGGSATKRKGLDGLEGLDELNLICAPDIAMAYQQGLITDEGFRGIQKKMLDFCQRTNYRFAILDAPHDQRNPEDILKWRNDIAGYDSMYGALYYPWVKIMDPVTGRSKHVPPCGHIAGIYARSDSQRGVHKAPANEDVAGVIDVGMGNIAVNVTKGEQALLNPVGINCIRKFPGRGVRVWGARTLATTDPAWRYINVRRLFNYVEESVERSMQWAVFEPNDVYLWAKVRRDITAFLRTVWRSGALFGVDPNQAFYVKCDEELNPPEIRDQGIMICEIGMAPVKPAEFVVFRFSQYALPSA